jgi:hypothetical protein
MMRMGIGTVESGTDTGTDTGPDQGTGTGIALGIATGTGTGTAKTGTCEIGIGNGPFRGMSILGTTEKSGTGALPIPIFFAGACILCP